MSESDFSDEENSARAIPYVDFPPDYHQLNPRRAEGPPPYHPAAVKQWASRVISFSSQYNSTTWSASQVCGEPRVYPQHGDIHGAWASQQTDAHQFILVEYDVAVCPTSINIYETYNPGAVVAVKILDVNGRWETLWNTARPVHLTQSRIFSPPLKETRSKTTQIRLEVNCSAAGTWCEIDAVQLVGIREGAVSIVDDQSFLASLHSLVNKKKFSDVSFKIDGKNIYAHKAILSSRSKYFHDMFDHGGDKGSADIKLPNLSYNDLLAALEFIYTNKLPHDVRAESLMSLIKASVSFQIPELKTAATYKLLEVMTCDNVIETYLIADTFKEQEDAKDLCLAFMADHLKELCKKPAFQGLPSSVMANVVQRAMEKL